MRYPLAEHEKERITSKTGKKFTDITLDEVMKGHVGPDDIKISKNILEAQGQVHGKQTMLQWRRILNVRQN